ncbi:molybdenum cofactor synthesis domain protein [Burkholderia thailandensis MSMB121]|uniref:molybdopterin molybdotransferase MoeA n=1 Tax=Burkholderia TaxID=32008 RepID=UPI0003280263|nr:MULTISPECIES: gephyrin-like molybdotransferase Glp [Burkholderia]AGK47885.1 molybdenum cofactor synthesis domain protein [Burkholderia thailandensis MSMB121]ATF36311.1 molybdopterin molybdenumtransferase MoeA [Burkholderia thailandensis]KST73704.1 molybdenum cofactor biosynthesis protein MoaA [Burkholderia humptydooensis]
MTTHTTPTPSATSEHAVALTVDEARALALRFAERVAQVERVALRDALGRVLADDVASPFDIPAYDNAAMDGYAFDGAALAAPAADGTLALAVAGRALAGHPFDGPRVAKGACVRIMTGAQMPAGCDTVIPQEKVDAAGDVVRFAASAAARGDHCRRAGEDLARGASALAAGRVMRAADLGLLASLGIADVAVRRRVRVALFSTGDELQTPGEPLREGGLYDSNRATLVGMLARLGVETLDLGIVRDDPAALESALKTAAAQADAVITSGGVSVGDADFTRALLDTLGDVTFASVAMRPGRPLACGRVWASGRDGRPALFFGLPGNPVAVAAAFTVIVRDALLAMMGADAQPLPRYPAICDAPLKKRAGRTEYLRGHAARDAGGVWRVTPAGSQSSASLKSLSDANCFIVLAHDAARVDAGATVDILPFDGAI